MATRRWMTLALFSIAVPAWGVVAIASDEPEEYPQVLRMTAISVDDLSGNEVSFVLTQDPLEEHGAVRTEKGFSQPPRILLERFPTLIVRRDDNKDYKGFLLDVDSGASYSMPLLDKNLFDQRDESLAPRFLYDKNLFEEHRIAPEDAWVSPDGGAFVFRDFFREIRESPLRSQLPLTPPPTIAPKTEVEREAPPDRELPDKEN